jgi:tetratricopeptide (TPR) repeat protein
MNVLIRKPFAALIVAVLIIFSCSKDAPPVDPDTARLLVGSQQALYRGNLSSARILADSAVVRAPNLPDAHFQQARLLSAMRQYDAAEQAYLRAVRLDADYHEAWINLGHNASRQLRYRDALQYYLEAAEAEPAKLGVYIGRTHVSLGNADSALAAYQGALAADSTNAPAHLWLSLLLKDQGKIDQALKHSQRALALEPGNIDYRYVLGAQLFTAGQLDAAKAHLIAVTEEQPWHYGAHYQLGRIMAQTGQAEEALRLSAHADSLQRLQGEAVRLEELIRMNPSNRDRWIQLGQIQQQLGRNQEAAQSFRVAESLTRSPDR